MFKKLTTPMTLLISTLVMPLQSVQADDTPMVPTIPQQVLLDYLGGKSGFTLLDARSAEEFEAGHIWGASNLPADADLQASEALPAALDAAIVVYCKSGMRATALQQSLLALGYTDVRVLGPAQMLWADELPVFNCGVPDPVSNTLVTVEDNKIPGNE